MTIHIFTCSKSLNKYGFTPDNTGKNLPISNCSEWVFWKTRELNYNIPILGIYVNSVLDMIKSDGFAIQESTINLSETLDDNE